PDEHLLTYDGNAMPEHMKSAVASLAARSSHPLSKILLKHLLTYFNPELAPESFTEYPGKGIKGKVNDMEIKLGSASFTRPKLAANSDGSVIHILIDSEYIGAFHITQSFRSGMQQLFKRIENICKTK